ncbi:MAG: MBL fold metallo-hydrolase [Bacteroidetes bacterium]|nr:MBL fold metallo-hydrolase [Bacteroidota bacterium]
MKLYTINTGFFKLDGGAMFGVVPKSIWTRTNPADENNMINMAMRALLVEDGNKLILIDNGCGTKQDAKFFSYYFLHGDDTLEKSLAKHGFTPDDITDVVLSHLHFDHCGGSVKWNSDRTKFELAFKNATYWSNERHWNWAMHPNKREGASFLKENILPIQESGHLKFITPPSSDDELASLPFGEGWGEALFSNGHTEAMMHPHIKYKEKTIVYVADLIPTTGHIPVPYIMGYDTRPLLTLDEKEKFLSKAATEEYVLFFEHDSKHECCTVKTTEKGVRMKEAFSLAECFS